MKRKKTRLHQRQEAAQARVLDALRHAEFAEDQFKDIQRTWAIGFKENLALKAEVSRLTQENLALRAELADRREVEAHAQPVNQDWQPGMIPVVQMTREELLKLYPPRAAGAEIVDCEEKP